MARGVAPVERVGVEKVTVSIPRPLLRYADQRAAGLRTTRSQVISTALAELQARELDQLAREGYAFYGSEAEQFAEAAARAVSQAIRDAG